MWPSPAQAAVALAMAIGSAAPSAGARREGIAPADSTFARRLDYRLLVRAREQYSVLAADVRIPSFESPSRRLIRPGDAMAGSSRLRERLIALGDLAPDERLMLPGRYAGTVVDGVRRFQHRHGLPEDGIIGPATVAALRVPLTNRVLQIEQSLEQIRGEQRADSGRYITVNVPAFRLLAYEGTGADTAPALDMKAIVGTAVRTPTPTLSAVLRYLEFHPYWNVPRSILVKEILPKLRRDSSYLRRQHMEMVGEGEVARGAAVTPEALAALRAGTLRVRQRPGPDNALGAVKFVFPNDSNVYLHDTPEKRLFANTRRDFSHGCIRLQDARDLAVWVTSGQPGWNADSVDAALAGTQQRRVTLTRTIPVFVEYNTALATVDGLVWFLPDVYRRDHVVREVTNGSDVKTP